MLHLTLLFCFGFQRTRQRRKRSQQIQIFPFRQSEPPAASSHPPQPCHPLSAKAAQLPAAAPPGQKLPAALPAPASVIPAAHAGRLPGPGTGGLSGISAAPPSRSAFGLDSGQLFRVFPQLGVGAARLASPGSHLHAGEHGPWAPLPRSDLRERLLEFPPHVHSRLLWQVTPGEGGQTQPGAAAVLRPLCRPRGASSQTPTKTFQTENQQSSGSNWGHSINLRTLVFLAFEFLWTEGVYFLRLLRCEDLDLKWGPASSATSLWLGDPFLSTQP